MWLFNPDYYYAQFSTMWIMIPAILFTIYAQARVKGAFAQYSRVPNARGYTGAQVARMLLDYNGLHSVEVEAARGSLTDHYDPRVKKVRLSEDTYGKNSLAAISVAAHEVGHAIQHAKGYGPLSLRSMLAPVANIGSQLSWTFIALGFLIGGAEHLIDIGIIMFAAVVLFQLITLPVEFNASKRAIVQMQNYGIIVNEEVNGANKVLSAAALTYVAAMLSAVLTLVRLIAMRNRNN